jgi:sirohydrochlorin ferrochelatase
MIDEAKVPVRQADTLGEDPRLVGVLDQRLAELGLCRGPDTGVLVVSVGSSHAAANARSATLAPALAQRGWGHVRVAFATAAPSVADGIAELRRSGASRIALAPWFIAPGRITDRVAEVAGSYELPMAEPLGAHRLVAETVLSRFDSALAAKLAA